MDTVNEDADRGNQNIVGCCSERCQGQNLRSMLLSLLFGQFLSLCLCGTGITSQMLTTYYSIDTPTTQSFINYFFLSVVFTTWLACQPVDQGIMKIAYSRGWKYFLLAIIDVEANFLIVKAYQYTTVTSVQLLDCFVIPVVLVLSFFILSVRYLIVHVIGVCICLLGVGCVVWADMVSGKQSDDNQVSNKLLGDLLCLGGAALYGVSNVFQESFVKNYSRAEYLGMVGLFGSVISAIQLVIVDRNNLLLVPWSNYKVVLLYLGFAVCMFAFYSLVTVLIQRTSAAFFNLSVLTADFYTLLAGLFIFKFPFHILYVVSFIFCVLGVIIYSLKPTSERPNRKNLLCTCTRDGSACCQKESEQYSIEEPPYLPTGYSVANTRELVNIQDGSAVPIRDAHVEALDRKERGETPKRIVRYCPKHGAIVLDERGQLVVEDGQP